MLLPCHLHSLFSHMLGTTYENNSKNPLPELIVIITNEVSYSFLILIILITIREITDMIN